MKTISELYAEHGYFSLVFEKMTEWEWYTDVPCCKLMLHLIIKCMKKDTSYRGEPVLRGQYRTSLNRLSEETGLSVKQIRIAIGKLEKTKEVFAAKSRAKQRTIVTLCNFEKYQLELLERGKGGGKAGAKVGQRYKEEEKKKEDNTVPFFEIISSLNKLTGKNFKHTTEAHQRFIRARWNEGHRLVDFITVIENKTRDPDFKEKFLRPETLFGTKFDSYLNENGGTRNRTCETCVYYSDPAARCDKKNPCKAYRQIQEKPEYMRGVK